MVRTARHGNQGTATAVWSRVRWSDGGSRTAPPARSPPLRPSRVAVEAESVRIVQPDQPSGEVFRLQLHHRRGGPSHRRAPETLNATFVETSLVARIPGRGEAIRR